MATETSNMGLIKWDSINDLFSHAQLSANFDRLDAHDHVPLPDGGHGGVQIPAGGLAPLSVGSANLQDGILTAGKIVDGTITAAKIASGAITNGLIAAGAGIVDSKLASPNNGVYQRVSQAAAFFTSSALGNNTYGITSAGGLIQSATSTAAGMQLFYFASADYSVAGIPVTKFRLRAQLLANATAPTVSYTVGLHPVTAVAGTSGNLSYTMGGAVTGSTIAFTTPGASSRNQSDSGDFLASVLTDSQYYAIGVVPSGAGAANSVLGLTAQLQVHNV